MIDKAFADIAQRNRTLEEIPAEELGDRGAATGEVLTVDFVGKIDGTEFPGGAGKDVEVEIGGSNFIPGFSEQLEGLKPGDSKTIEVTFPAEYGVPTLAGKAASFDVTAHKLSRAIVPAADDELAKKLGFDDLAGMRSAITERFQSEYDQMSRLRLKRQLLDALSGMAEFASPEGMVEQEFAQIWQRLEAERQQGRLDDDDKDKDEDTLKADYRKIAERRVRLGLLLAEIGRVNSITVAPEEMTRAMRVEASRFPGREQQVFEFFRQNPQAAELAAGADIRGQGGELHPRTGEDRGPDGHGGGTGEGSAGYHLNRLGADGVRPVGPSQPLSRPAAGSSPQDHAGQLETLNSEGFFWLPYLLSSLRPCRIASGVCQPVRWPATRRTSSVTFGIWRPHAGCIRRHVLRKRKVDVWWL